MINKTQASIFNDAHQEHEADGASSSNGSLHSNISKLARQIEELEEHESEIRKPLELYNNVVKAAKVLGVSEEEVEKCVVFVDGGAGEGGGRRGSRGGVEDKGEADGQSSSSAENNQNAPHSTPRGPAHHPQRPITATVAPRQVPSSVSEQDCRVNVGGE